MKKRIMLILIIFVVAGCGKKVTSDILVGGKWIGTAGYQDGKVEGEPYCYPFHLGIEFKDETTVYVEEFESDIEYYLYDKGLEITFIDRGPASLEESHTTSFQTANYTPFTYKIKKVNDNKIILEGKIFTKDDGCQLERK